MGRRTLGHGLSHGLRVSAANAEVGRARQTAKVPRPSEQNEPSRKFRPKARRPACTTHQRGHSGSEESAYGCVCSPLSDPPLTRQSAAYRPPSPCIGPCPWRRIACEW